MDWDMSVGMGLVLEVAPEVLWDDWKLKLPESYELCGAIDSQTPNPRAVSSSSDLTSSNDDSPFSALTISQSWLVILLPVLCLVVIACGLFWYNRSLSQRLDESEARYKALATQESTHNVSQLHAADVLSEHIGAKVTEQGASFMISHGDDCYA
jgi:hypothetical protein